MSGHGLLERMLGNQLIVNGMLIVIAVSTLTFAYRHLRYFRRIPSPANPPGPAADGGRWTGGDPWMTPPPRAAAGHPKPAGTPRVAAGAAAQAEDYPSRPGGQAAPVTAPAWDAGSVEVAAWILADANAHAAEIRHEARDHTASRRGLTGGPGYSEAS